MGKLDKFYEENCLLQQEFVEGQHRDRGAVYRLPSPRHVGGTIQLQGLPSALRRARVMEKKQENFAEEIAKQLGQA